jgi:hypothetical protein
VQISVILSNLKIKQNHPCLQTINRVGKRTALTEIDGHAGENVDYQRKFKGTENGVLHRTTFLIRADIHL